MVCVPSPCIGNIVRLSLRRRCMYLYIYFRPRRSIIGLSAARRCAILCSANPNIFCALLCVDQSFLRCLCVDQSFLRCLCVDYVLVLCFCACSHARVRSLSEHRLSGHDLRRVLCMPLSCVFVGGGLHFASPFFLCSLRSFRRCVSFSFVLFDVLSRCAA